MALVDFTVDEHVAVITMNSGENRLNPPFLTALLDTLETVEQQTDATSLVVTASHEKIFSNGLDLDWLLPAYQKGDFATTRSFFYLMNQAFERILLYPMVTVAAISGHAFAGGALLACVFDFRFMRSDRGYFCLPEVDLGIPFTPGMNAILKKAVPMHMVEEMELTGVRLTAAECERYHIVRKAVAQETLMAEAMAFAKSQKKNRPILREMKKRLHRDIVRVFAMEDPPVIESDNLHAV